MPNTRRRLRAGSGAVMLIGGAEDKLKARLILSRFVKLAGGAEADIVVVSTASMLGDVTTETYRTIFTELGAPHVTGVRPEERAEAEDPTGRRHSRQGDRRVPDRRQSAPAHVDRGGHPARLRHCISPTTVERSSPAPPQEPARWRRTCSRSATRAPRLVMASSSWPLGSGSRPTWWLTSTSNSERDWDGCCRRSPSRRRSSVSGSTRTRPRSSRRTGRWTSSAAERSPSSMARTCRPTRTDCGDVGP